jgi:hypothetical protein
VGAGFVLAALFLLLFVLMRGSTTPKQDSPAPDQGAQVDAQDGNNEEELSFSATTTD